MKIGKSSIIFENVYLKSSAVVVGPKEKKGPLEKYFDYCFDKLNCNEKSWEKAEIKMYNTAASIALKKNKIDEKDIELVVSGDLNNQIIIGSYAMRDYDTPYLGIFSACASSVEGLIMASLLIDRCGYHNIMVNVSSHNAMAEKQFRYPNEYGCQKPKYITSTVTSSTSVILSSDFSDIKITRGTIGTVVDYSLKDPQDLGRAMAPSCYYTLKQHLEDFEIDIAEYDLILSGDLSTFGKELFLNICYSQEIYFHDNYEDAGTMIYDLKSQNVYSGGSGCGCLPAVAFSFILNQMRNKVYKKVLLLATGALHNPSILCQKESIPGITHAIALEVVE